VGQFEQCVFWRRSLPGVLSEILVTLLTVLALWVGVPSLSPAQAFLYGGAVFTLAAGSIVARWLERRAEQAAGEVRDEAAASSQAALIGLVKDVRAQMGPETPQSTLKFRALRLAADIIEFLADRWASPPEHPERAGAIDRNDEAAMHRIFQEETTAAAQRFFQTTAIATKRFSARVPQIRDELADASLRDPKLDTYVDEYGVENMHVLRMMGERIANLAGQLPD
jgi:hypothetical protein